MTRTNLGTNTQTRSTMMSKNCTQNTSSHADFSESCQSSQRFSFVSAFHTCTRVAQVMTVARLRRFLPLQKITSSARRVSQTTPGHPRLLFLLFDTTYLHTPAPSTLTGIGTNPFATLLLKGQSGYLASPLQTLELLTHRALEAGSEEKSALLKAQGPLCVGRCNRDTPLKATERDCQGFQGS